MVTTYIDTMNKAHHHGAGTMEKYLLDTQAAVNEALSSLHTAATNAETEDEAEAIEEVIDDLDIIESRIADLWDEIQEGRAY